MAATDTSNFDFTFTVPRRAAPESSGGIRTFRGDSRSGADNGDEDPTGSHFTANVLPSVEPVTQDAEASEVASTGASSVLFTPPTTPGTSHGGDEAPNESPTTPTTPTPGRDGELTEIDQRPQDVGGSTPLATPMRIPEVTDALNTLSDESSDVSPGLQTSEPSREPYAPLLFQGVDHRQSALLDVPAHYAREEITPGDRFNEPNFQSAFRDAKKLMSSIQDTLASDEFGSSLSSKVLRLHHEAQTLSAFHCPATRTVAFVGDSGVGKRSLLNSLLDHHDLAHGSDAGAACVRVATEYHYHDRTYFIVESHQYTEEEMSKQLVQLLQVYRNFHLNELTIDKEERDHHKEMAEGAKHTLEAMFRGQFSKGPPFTKMTEGEGLAVLYGWLSDILPCFGEVERTTFPDLRSCSKALARLTADHFQGEGYGLWPFMKKIKIYLSAHILRQGLVLVDLPGIRDHNTVRRHFTERKLIECDAIFAVCIEGNAMADNGVANVMDLAKWAKLDNVGIICTKSDVSLYRYTSHIRANEAIKTWKETEIALTGRYSEDVTDAQQAVLDATKALIEYDESHDGMREGAKGERKRLRRKLNSALLRGHLIDTQNEDTKRKLRELYEKKIPMQKPAIFCVSNTYYWDNRDDDKLDVQDWLKLSGIPAVRQYCMGMASESQRRVADHYIKHRIPALVYDVDLWVQSGSEVPTPDTKQDVKNALDTTELQLKRDLLRGTSEINTIASTTKDLFKSRIYNYCTMKFPCWSADLIGVTWDWDDWVDRRHAVYSRTSGEPCGTVVRSHDWNEKAIGKMIEDLDPLYSQLRSSLEKTYERVISRAQTYMDFAIRSIDKKLDGSNPAILALRGVINTRQHLLKRDMETACERAVGDINILRIDALSVVRSSFFGQAMEAVYRCCLAECGKGGHLRREKMLKTVLRRDTLPQELIDKFKATFDDIADKLQEELRTTVYSHLESLRETLDMIRSEDVALDSTRDSEFRERVQERVKLANEEIKRVHELVGV
ncbi:hypothetical protein PG984_013110 [Apiospora sp. TS-2023a]